MNIKCLIIDDEPLAIQVLERHLAQLSDLELVDTFQNPIEAFELLQTTSIDLIFLDIQMPLLTGIDFIKSLENPPKVVFTTAHRNYAMEGYELDVVDYLLKPITFNRFFKSVNKFKSRTNIPFENEDVEVVDVVNDHLFVNVNKKFVKIIFDQIFYIESIKDYVRIYTSDQTIVTKDKISEFEKKLSYNFLRIHRSFIVNTSKVTAFTTKDVEISDQEIPIGESYKAEVMRLLKSPHQ